MDIITLKKNVTMPMFIWPVYLQCLSLNIPGGTGLTVILGVKAESFGRHVYGGLGIKDTFLQRLKLSDIKMSSRKCPVMVTILSKDFDSLVTFLFPKDGDWNLILDPCELQTCRYLFTHYFLSGSWGVPGINIQQLLYEGQGTLWTGWKFITGTHRNNQAFITHT